MEPKDTAELQLMSVDAFANALGYWRNSLGNNSYIEEMERVFPCSGKGLKGCHTISFGTMVKLHNAMWLKRYSKPGYYYPDIDQQFYFGVPCSSIDGKSAFVVDGYKLAQLIARKICDKVFLQADKHGVMTCHKHWLKFCDSSYEAIFLGGE